MIDREARRRLIAEHNARIAVMGDEELRAELAAACAAPRFDDPAGLIWLADLAAHRANRLESPDRNGWSE